MSLIEEASIAPVARPRAINAAGPLFAQQNCVRTYRVGPRTIALQIRFTDHIAHIDLTDDEAAALIEALQRTIAGGRA